VLAEELEFYLPFWQQSDTLPKWDITILPNWLGCYLLANP
jgi:hypothetical protein